MKLTQLECPWKKTVDKSGALEHTEKQFSFPYRDRFGTAGETAAAALYRVDGHGGLCRSTLDILPENAPILPAMKADGIYSQQISGWLQVACKSIWSRVPSYLSSVYTAQTYLTI